MRATLAVMATYLYFLLFAQYGFLHLLKALPFSGNATLWCLGFMGGAGLLSSLWCGLIALPFDYFSSNTGMRAGFLGCMVAALVALTLHSFWLVLLVSALLGASLGVLTVSMATSLPAWLGGRLGTGIGLGTGLAYALANLPLLFEGSFATIGVFSGILAGIGVFLVPGKPLKTQHTHQSDITSYLSPWSILMLLLGLAVLVWLDSAAFFVMQETPALKSLIWESPTQKTIIALSHLLGALGLGLLLDRTPRVNQKTVVVRFALLAFLGLATGYALLDKDVGPEFLPGLCYATGVSFYSVLLVILPGLALCPFPKIGASAQAGLIFGLAGWFGSANGIGMVRDLGHVPTPFFLISTLIMVLLGLLVLQGKSLSLIFAMFCALLATSTSGTSQIIPQASSTVRGRGVFIAQGCIHCHSQYVRAETADTRHFGAPGDLDGLLGHHPPLLGYRRQGPDLTHTGSRKPRAWQKEHLINPRRMIPGSVMPSYAHLFEAPSSQGEDLLDYLEQLH
jgi:cytochrome c oxidase cbb3-type subunit 2